MRLITSGTRDWAFFVLQPVYDKGQKPHTVEGRRTALIGFVVGAYRLRPTLTQAIRDTPALIATLSVFIGAGSASPAVVYAPAERGFVENADPPASAMRIVRAFSVLGQDWRLQFDFAPDVVDAMHSSVPWGWLMAGLLLTAAATYVLATQGARRRAVEAVVAERTADLARANERLRLEVARREVSEKETREGGELLRAVIDESPFAIVSVDPKRKVLLWNRAAERIFGYTAEEVIGSPYPLVPPEEQAGHDALIARTAAGERVHGIAAQRRRKDGKLIDTVIYGAPLHAADGSLRAMVFMLEDVTERLSTERQLQQALRIEAVGQLTGGIAHDFNNILGVVVGNLDLALERLAADSTTRGYVDSALGSALRGAELVKSLLAFARRTPLAPRSFDVNERLPELSAMLRRTLGEGITVVTVPGENLWPALADPTQVESAVLNLAINARDAMPRGGTLTIETANATLDATYAALNHEVVPGDYVMIAVSDTGTGMAPEVIERAFEPFYTTKSAGQGSGLGLAMIHGFARQSKGHVKIYSELEHGTTVRLYLPRAESVSARAEATPVVHAVPRGSESVLLVEDNAALRAAAEMLLRELGYRVRTAENGPDALRLLESGEPADVLFTDIVMPGGMSGYELAAEAARRRPGIKLLFATGFAGAAVVASKEKPVAPVLSKPYRKAELATALRRVLAGNGGRA